MEREAGSQTIDGFTQFTGACTGSKHYYLESAGTNLPPSQIFTSPLIIMKFISSSLGTLAISTSQVRDLIRRLDTNQEQVWSFAEVVMLRSSGNVLFRVATVGPLLLLHPASIFRESLRCQSSLSIRLPLFL